MLTLKSPLLPRDSEGFLRRLPEELPVDPSVYLPFRENDVTMKTRLPLVVWNALDTTSEISDRSRAKKARELLFVHMYGHYDLMIMRELNEGFFYRPLQARQEVLKSSVYYELAGDVEEQDALEKTQLDMLGMASKEMQLAMPAKMREDVLLLADQIGRTAGRTIREVIVRELFGWKFELSMHEALGTD